MEYNNVKEILAVDDKFVSLCEYFKSIEDILGVFIFGSYGTAAQNINSDIDLGILFEAEKSTWQLCEIQSQIMNILGTDRVDTVNLNTADSILAFEIVSRNQLIYCSDKEKVNSFILACIKRYQRDYYRYSWACKLYLEVIGN